MFDVLGHLLASVGRSRLADRDALISCHCELAGDWVTKYALGEPLCNVLLPEQ